MSKKGILLFGLVILAMTFAMPGVASAKTYHGFTATLHEAYEGYDLTAFPSSLEVGSQINDPTELGNLSSSDNERAVYNGTVYVFHRFKFKIDEAVLHIAQISALHEGYGNTSGHSLSIWNGNTGSWELLDSTGVSGPPDRSLNGVTGGFSDYIKDGYLNLLAVTHDQGTHSINTDYVEVEITIRTYTGVPTLTQWGMIAMGILFAAFLIWTVRRRWVFSADRSQGK